jgi:hypothetical protein
MKKKGKRPVGGRFIIIILILVLLLFGFFVGPIRALTNEILVGGLVNLCAVFVIMAVFFYFTLWLAGPHVLPVDPRNKTEKANARRLLRRYALGGRVTMAVVREGAALPGPHGENRDSVSGVGVVDADSVSIFTLHSPLALSRIRGTGLVFTREHEFLKQIIDLRIQLRFRDFTYITRDGISVKARVVMRFQIDSTVFNKNLHAHDSKHPYPVPITWSIPAVRRTLQKMQAADSTGTLSNWSDIPIFIANGALRAIISEYTFDQLTKPQDPEANPRGDIRAALDKRVRPFLLQSGIKVLVLGVGLFAPNDLNVDKVFDPEKPEIDKITQQRINTWKAEWESRINRLRGETQAEVERQRETIMAQARQESILLLAQALESGLPPGGDQDKIAQHFWKIVQKIADEPSTRPLLEEDYLRIMAMQLQRPPELLALPPDQTQTHGTPSDA